MVTMEASFMSCIITILYKCDQFPMDTSILLKDVSAEVFHIYDSSSHVELCQAAQNPDVCSNPRILHWLDSSVYKRGAPRQTKASLDLPGRVLKLGTVHNMPFTYNQNDSDGSEVWIGSEIDLVQLLAHKFEFSWSIHDVSDDEYLGEYNTTIRMYQDGLYGRLIKMETDAAVGQVLYESAHFLPGLRPLLGFEKDGLCFMFKSKPPMSRWLKILRPFGLYTWLFLIGSLVACTLFLSLLRRLDKFSGSSWLSIWSLEMSQGSKIRSYEPSHLVFFLTLLLTLVVIKSGYCGVLLSFLTIDVYPKSIRTVRELEASNKPIISLIYSDWLIFHEAGFEQLAANVVETTPEVMFDDVINMDGALVDTQSLLDFNIRKELADENGYTDMIILEQCWSIYDVAVLFQDRSPYVELFKPTMAQIVEGGIYGKIKKCYMEREGNLIRLTRSLNASEQMGIEDLQVPFFLLLIMWALSGLVLAFELTCRH